MLTDIASNETLPMPFQRSWLPIKEGVPSVTDMKMKLKAAHCSESTRASHLKPGFELRFLTANLIVHVPWAQEELYPVQMNTLTCFLHFRTKLEGACMGGQETKVFFSPRIEVLVKEYLVTELVMFKL